MKTGFLWITLALLLHLHVNGQEIKNVNEAKLDSLRLLIKSNISDTLRLDAYIQFASLARGYYDSLSTVTYTDQALKIARKLGFWKEELYLLQQASYIYYDNWYLDTTIYINKEIITEAALINDSVMQLESYKLIGDSFWWRQSYDSALLYYDRGLSLAESIKDINLQNEITLEIADTYGRMKRNPEAIEFYQKAEKIFRLRGDQKNIAKCLTRIGRVYANQGNVESALKYFQKASKIAIGMKDLDREGEISISMGEMYEQNNDFSKAVHYYEQAIETLLVDGNQYNAILIHLRIGMLYLQVRNYRSVMLVLNRVNQLNAEVGDESLMVDALSMQAKLEYRQGEFAKALESMKKSLQLYIKQERKYMQLYMLLNMGSCLQKLQAPKEAIGLYHQAISIGYEIKDTLSLAESHLAVALAYGRLNQLDSADAYFNKAMQYYDQISVKEDIVIGSYIEAGNEYVNRAEIPKGLALYEKAFFMATNNRDTMYLGILNNKIANLYQVQANYDVANSYYQKSLDLYEASKNTFGIASSNKGLAILNKDQGNYQESINYAQKAVVGYQSIDNYCKTSEPLKVIGESYLFLKQPDTALTYLLNAEKVADKCSDLLILTDVNHLIGKVYDDLGDQDRSFRYYEEAMLLAQKSHNREVLMKTARTLYPLYEEKGQVARALEVFKIFHANNDSINKKENSKALIRKELASLHEKELQEAALLQQQKDERQQWIIYAIVAACFALLVIALAVYRNYRNKYKANLLLRQQNKKIARQKAELEALDESKSRFFANISHELRTPLTLISSPLKGLLSNPPEPIPNVVNNTLQLMERNTKKLKGLVNDILDLSKLESNEIAISEREVSIHALLNRVFSNYQSLASHLGIWFAIDLQSLPDETLLLDAEKLEKILNNLLSNAIKHTPSKNKVTLIALIKEEQLWLEVQDTGVGIPAEDLPYIFDRFYQSKQSDTPIQGGTGIGLALAKELCQLMGGTITVDSTPGKGSVFAVAVPYQPVDLPTIATVQESFPENKDDLKHLTFIPIKAADKSSTVLIVEDHPDMQQFVNSLISPHHHTLLANNGVEALEILEKKTVDLIISDVMMPEMDGYALLQTLKDSDSYRSIPVVMLTALSDEQHKLQALTTGVDDYLTKPFSPDELLARVRNLLERSEEKKQWQEAEKNLTAVGEVQKGLQNHHEDLCVAVKEGDIDWLKKIEKAIEAGLENENFRLSDLASEFFLSVRQFHRKIKKITGLSPKQYEQEVALQKARRLLEGKKYDSVKAVAISIGQYQTYRFNKSYHERFGKHPKEYFDTLV